MMRVRFSTGLTIQYNGARFVTRAENYTDLYTKDGGGWIAQVPNDAIIETVSPCSVEFRGGTPNDRVEALLTDDSITSVSGSLLRELKIRLRGFNAQTWRWS